MANTFFEPGERAQKVQELFGLIAHRYDLINDVQSFRLHRFWKRRVVSLTGAKAGLTALDICCGTGDIAKAVARRGASAIGLDFSREMLEVASNRVKAAAEEHSGLCFIRGNAQQLPFAANSFDFVTMGYGLRNLADWKIGLDEMLRVVKPRGRIVILEFGKPDQPFWRKLYISYLRLCVPILGRIFAGNAGAYSYILESLKNYPAQHGVADRMRELGMSQVNIHNFFGGAMTINYGEKAA